MNYYFVDFENVNSLNGIDKLKDSKFYILFSKNSQKIAMSLLSDITKNGNTYELIEIADAGKSQALDIQLICILSNFATIHSKKANVYIVSKDHGYDIAIKCIKSKINSKLDIKRIDAINELANKGKKKTQDKALNKKEQKAILKKEIKKIIGKDYEKHIDPIVAALVKNKSGKTNTETAKRMISRSFKSNESSQAIARKILKHYNFLLDQI